MSDKESKDFKFISENNQMKDEKTDMIHLMPHFVSYFKSQEEYIGMLEMAVQLLQREVDNLRNSMRMQDKSFDINKKSLKSFSKLLTTFNTCSNTMKIAKKLHQQVSQFYPLIESNLFMISPDINYSPVINKDMPILDSIYYKLSKTDLLKQIINSKIPTIVGKIAEHNNGSLFNAIILPIVLRNITTSLFIAITDEQIFDWGQDQIESFSIIAQSAAIAIDNIKSVEEISQMNQRLNLLNNEIIQSNKYASFGELASMIMQEIESPIKIIKGNFKLLENGVGNKYRRMQIIRENIDKIDTITNKLSGITKYQFIEKPTVIDISTLIDEVVLFSSSQLLRDGIIVDKQYSNDNLQIVGAKTQLEQVLLNIILNARDSMIDGGIISIFVNKTFSKMVLIKISDNRKGINDNEITSIFDPFRKMKGNNKIGLGLFLAKNIIEQHKGKISVSFISGKGTIYKIKMPLYSNES